MSQTLLFKSENPPVRLEKSTDFKLLYLVQNSELVSLVVFETLLGTLIVLQISKVDSLPVNFAGFPNIAENQDWFCLVS